MAAGAVFWLWLAASVSVFWALPTRLRSGFLAATSFAYVAWLDAWVAVGLAAWALLYHALARRRTSVRLLWLVSAALLVLAYFKYLPALFEALGAHGALRIVVPLGLSYFCFKLIHFAVEAHRGAFADSRLDDFLAYIFLFPAFTAGPIERYDHFLRFRNLCWQSDDTVEGLTRIAHGLIKKFVFCEALLAPQLAERDGLSGILQIVEVMPVHQVWLFFVLSFLYLYLDFGAYTDIAIGASRLFGIRLIENFRWPIVATSIVDFWKRWHQSLAGWCQAYVYLPVIGLTRRPVLATYASFMAMGLWHNASWAWIAWGLTHASAVVGYGYWARARRRWRLRMPEGAWTRVLTTPATLAVVVMAGVFTSLDGRGTPVDAARIFGRMLGF